MDVEGDAIMLGFGLLYVLARKQCRSKPPEMTHPLSKTLWIGQEVLDACHYIRSG